MKFYPKHTPVLCIIGLYLLAASFCAATPAIVAPNSAATTEGDVDNSAPFDPFGAPLRYQQLFAASQFGALGSTGGLITQLLFRPDAFFGQAFNTTLTDIQISLSTTSVSDDGLSLDMTSNVGLDNTVVYGRGALTLSSAFTGPANGPKDFDITISLTIPFFYNPALGNLLMDVRMYSVEHTTSFDAVLDSGDGVSRVYCFGDADGTTANVRDSGGLVTGFNYNAVPEPSVFALIGIGAILVCRRKRAKIELD